MAFEISKDYPVILNSLKEKIKQARVQATIAVNNVLLSIYWEIGDTISKQEQANGWGTKTVEKLAVDLSAEFQDMKGLSPRNLRYMRDFALAYPQFPMLQPLVATLQEHDNQLFTILQRSVAKLPWGHNCTLLDKLKSTDERLFYAQKAVINGWTRDMMVNQIESGLYKRQGALTNNFEVALPAYESELAVQFFKDPYHFGFLQLSEAAKERDLEDALMNNVIKFLLELGEGFAFMSRQKRFEAGGKEFFIDLLFYNTKLKRHIIIDLKIGEFEPEFVSKMNFYLGIADDTLKGEYDKPAIGLILCKKNNRVIAEYALRDSSKPIGIAEYKIVQMLPDDIKSELPSIEEIEQRMDEELMQQQSPVDARLKSIKEKLKEFKGDEIQTLATYSIVHNLFHDGLKPLYKQLIEKLSVFDDAFQTKTVAWHCTNKRFTTFEQLDEFWNYEENTRATRDFNFEYILNGFKKAGTENYSEYMNLRFEMNTYWYGFTLTNYNNGLPFLKKLYHQPLTAADRQTIIDAVMSKVMDRIEGIIDEMSKR